MKKIAFAAAACMAAQFAFGIAASQEWVIRYCADHGMTVTNTARGNTAYVYGEGTNAVSIEIVRPTAYAIVAADCTQGARLGGITNGMTFAYHQPYCVFLNEPAQKRIWVDVNPTDLSYTYFSGSLTGRVYAAQTWMVDPQTNRLFRVYGTRIYDAEAHSLTNGFNGGGL